jgi:hypothetical protein
MTRWPAMLVFIAAAVSLESNAQDQHSNYHPPVATLARYEFADGRELGVVSGTWAASGGTFNSTSTITAIATIDSYLAEIVEEPDLTSFTADKFWYRARMLNQRSGSNTRVGIVYLYQDPSNFYEASFSPTGAVFVREIANGMASTVATGTYTGGGQNKWFDVEVAWTASETVIRVNGLPVIRGIKQNARTGGRVGLITRQTTAKFDRLLATRAYGDQPFRESFSAGAPAWDEVLGNWNAVDGVYQNSEVEHAGIVLLPIFVGFDFPSETRSFSVCARMLNPYGASGNRMGFVYDYEDRGGGFSTYKEVVFGPDGIARANSVMTFAGPGGFTTVSPGQTAPYPGRRGEWFDVGFGGSAVADLVSVSVDGTAVFTNLGGSFRGPVGLVTHWTPGRFDDVWFGQCDSSPRIERFDTDNPFAWFPARGTWDTEGGVLNNRTAGANDIAYMLSGRSTDYTVSARMLNPYGGPGNRIGLIFNFDSQSGDYYEAVFAPTGEAYLNKFIQGQLTRIATATHTALGRNVWFTAQVARRGLNATVKVNGQAVFQRVPAAQLDDSLDSGFVGVISHWSPAHFDDLRYEDFVPR